MNEATIPQQEPVGLADRAARDNARLTARIADRFVAQLQRVERRALESAHRFTERNDVLRIGAFAGAMIATSQILSTSSASIGAHVEDTS